MHNEILLSFIKKNIWLQIQNHKRVSYRKKHTSQIFFSKLSLFPSVLVIKIIHYHISTKFQTYTEIVEIKGSVQQK